MRRFIEIVTQQHGNLLAEGRTENEVKAMYAPLFQAAEAVTARRVEFYKAKRAEGKLKELPDDLKQAVIDRMSGEATNELKSFVDESLKWAKEKLQRHDRVVWFMRMSRMYYCQQSNHPEMKSLGDRYLSDYRKKCEIPDATSPAEHGFMDNITINLEHYLSLPIQAMQQLDFGGKGYADLMREMRDLEREWQEARKSTLVAKPEDELILDCGDGWAWFHLPRAACKDEGGAMGHCGNSPRANSKDTILSLRKKSVFNGHDMWKPYATFIRDVNGNLTEMKGRFNKKPGKTESPETRALIHKHIVQLLHTDHVNDLVGGGHAPEQNFNIVDLDDEDRKGLLDKRPELGMAAHYAESHEQDDLFVQKLEQELENEMPARSFHCEVGRDEIIVWKGEVAELIDDLRHRIRDEVEAQSIKMIMSMSEMDFDDFFPALQDPQAQGTSLIEVQDFIDRNEDLLDKVYAKGYESIEQFTKANNKRLGQDIEKCGSKCRELATNYLKSWLRCIDYAAPIVIQDGVQKDEIIATVDSLLIAKGLLQHAHLNNDEHYEVDHEGSVITTVSEDGWFGTDGHGINVDYDGRKATQEGIMRPKMVVNKARIAARKIMSDAISKLL